MLAYVVKAHLHIHKAAQKGNGAGEAQTTSNSGSSKAHPRNHQTIKVHLHKPRGAQRNKGKWKPKLRTQRKGYLVWAPSRDVPGKPQLQCAGVTPRKMRQHWSTFWIRKRQCRYILGFVGNVMGCRGRGFQDYTRLMMGCLGEEKNVGKGRDLGDLKEEEM